MIEAKDSVIAEKKILIEGASLTVRDRVKLLMGQDVKSVQSASMMKYNETTPDTETEFKPFSNLTSDDFHYMYKRVGIARFACERMARDIFQNGINIPEVKTKTTEVIKESKRNKNLLLDRNWKNMNTPQNKHWGLAGLLKRWVTLERKYGWGALAKKNDVYFVFSEDEYQDKSEHYPKKGDTIKYLMPKQFECTFQYENFKHEETFQQDECIILVTRPRKNHWKGWSILEPIYPELVYITNMGYGNAQSIWRFGVGNYVVYHDKGTNLADAAANFGSMGNKKTLHMIPLADPNLDQLGRVQNVGISGTIHNVEPILKFYYSIILAYLEVPETWYWGTGAGALASSYMNAIQYESTIQNEREDYYNPVLEAINLIAGNITEFDWQAAQRMDELTKAEMLEGISFLTPNEKRERFDPNLKPLPEGNELVDTSMREFEITSEPNDNSQTPKVDEK